MDEQNLETLIGQLLSKQKKTLAVAESCTGGLVGHRLTNVPGSSSYFLGGVIAYAYDVKTSLLGVRQETLELHGAVSRETVLEMAQGVRRALGADIGLSVSGIAGPDGGSPEKPVGLAWIGLSAGERLEAWQHQWQGDRQQVKEQTAQQALQLLYDHLRESGKLKGAEPVEVIVRWGTQGQVQPLRIMRHEESGGSRGREVAIDLGRQWEDAAGKHFLVMDPAEKVYELVLTPENRWLLKHPGRKTTS
jgi:PncC family amidohydrolase